VAKPRPTLEDPNNTALLPFTFYRGLRGYRSGSLTPGFFHMDCCPILRVRLPLNIFLNVKRLAFLAISSRNK
jgi:hypothetical protein